MFEAQTGSANPELPLKRNISLFDGAMFVISLMIGSGIFLKPQAMLADSGSSGMALWLWVVGGVITMCCGLTLAGLPFYWRSQRHQAADPGR